MNSILKCKKIFNFIIQGFVEKMIQIIVVTNMMEFNSYNQVRKQLYFYKSNP
jgi:uncharacterized membrane protein